MPHSAPPASSESDPALTALRRSSMDRFAEMYRARHFDVGLFELERGYLQTTLSDDARMPLRFFVEYNNAWWFEIITAVEVPTAAYDPASGSGFIVLDIHYDDDVLRAAQHVHFDGEKISRIRTYASSTFFSTPTQRVRLDQQGNAIWLETGYDLAASTSEARRFLSSAVGREFARSEPTAGAVARIEANLTDLDARLSTF
ncbi:hypothetical protein ACFVU2_06095 [Leifsonia sp. NPDC058194]|uniref:hypothetical protein n=1 Tax=Leifsonia sp. NPDC058194 TaxID=3346374 RepID=UPI0036DB1459